MAAGTSFQVYSVILFLSKYTVMPQQMKHDKEEKNFTMINFNNKYIEFTWTAGEKCSARNPSLFYEFSGSSRKECINYLLKEDCSIRCRFKNETPDQISVSIHNSSVGSVIFNEKLMTYNYVKPDLPKNVTITWKNNTVIVTCDKQEICYKCELHYKSKFDEDWQSREKDCCSITDSGFDPEKCHSFRVRLKRTCSTNLYHSEWSPITFWKNGTSTNSCSNDELTNVNLSRNVILIISLVVALATFILLYCICKVERLQKQIMPLVPDPKYIFSDLFENHNGNFQAWLDESGNVAKQAEAKCLEKECIIDEEMDDDGKEEDGNH